MPCHNTPNRVLKKKKLSKLKIPRFYIHCNLYWLEFFDIMVVLFVTPDWDVILKFLIQSF